MPAAFSLVTTCVRRWAFLQRSLPSWCTLPGRGNIFIVTYAFDAIPTSGLEQAHLIVVQEKQFHRTRALNLGAKVAREVDTAPYLLLTDADIVVRSGQLLTAPLRSTPAPDYVLDSPHALGMAARQRLGLDIADDPERRERGMRGTHWVRASLFFGVHGFNQHLQGWGFDDFELYKRYQAQSSDVAYYDRSALHHQPHGDALRVELQQESPAESVTRNKAKAQQFADPATWADNFGYPDYEVRLPTAP